VDIVSKNGSLLLNIGPRSDGTIPEQAQTILLAVGGWLNVNGEAIYGTRPWKMFGEGPGTQTAAVPGQRFNENNRKDLTAEDVRFTTKGKVLYAFVMGWPQKEAVIKPLGTNNAGMKVSNVALLGFKGKLQWTQGADGLKVQMPPAKPCDHAITLKISGA
jgi:alpha-L-fucosidase